MRNLGPSRRKNQRGFALLLVFAMAAAVALMLYKELPRAVFESQRAKEEMLVERGDEYKMGFKRYYQKFRKFPQSMDELDNTNGQRFLRRRYKDPFTGKDEWKLIKMDAAGNLIDSVQSKKSATDKDDKKGGTGSVSLGYSLGDAANQTGQGEGPNAATQRRSSDRGIGADLAMQQYQQRDQAEPGAPPPPPDQQQGTVVQLPPGQGQSQPAFPGQPGMPQLIPQTPAGGGPRMPQIPGMPAGFPQQGPLPIPPGLNLPGMVPQQPGQPVQQPGGGMAQPGLGSSGSGMAQPGLGSAGQTGPMPGNPNGARVNFTPGQGFPSGIGVAPPNTGGSGPSPAANQAIPGILNGLTNPQRGMQVGQPGMFGAGGIVGVASKHKAEGIKLIEERSKINEWEFIYDPRKDKRITGQAGGGLSNAPAGGLPSGSQPGNSNLSGFGNNNNSSSSGTIRK